MTSPVADSFWDEPVRDIALPGDPPSGAMPASAMRVAQLQGVVMAVYGVSALAAIRELRWHSAQLGTSVVALAVGVMSEIDRRRMAMTPKVLRSLLTGELPARTGSGAAQGPGLRRPADRLVSGLHLVETDRRPAPLSVTAESWRWQRAGLSRREAQVLHLIGEGLSNQEIAAAMFVTVNTVKSYVRSMYRKIEVTNRANAVRWALTHGQAGSARPRTGTDPTWR